MKSAKTFLFILFFIGSLNSYSQSVSFKTYTNAVIPGDHSDCTLTKIGNDYYTTGSSFNPTPVIYHSTDLVHWRAIAQPVSASWAEYGDKDHAGCWGGQIVHYNNKYWDFFSQGGTMCFVTADKPEGPWSLPTRIKNPQELPYTLGYDNSIFIDDDGKWYMVVKNSRPNNGIVELGLDGQPTGKVYNLNWLNPESKNFPFSWAEGPVMWKRNGYYYYSCAHDVEGGQKVLRSKVLSEKQEDWTTPVDFFNENDPLKPQAIFSGPNHSSAAVELADGTSWVLHPVWARANNYEWYGQGRQGILNQVRYKENGSVVADYPINKAFTAPNLPTSGISWMVPKSDFFENSKLNPEWSFLGYTPDSTHSLTAREGWFRMFPRSISRLNTIIKTDAEHNYSLITKVDFTAKTAKDEAGLRLMNGDETMDVKVYSAIDEKNNTTINFSFLKTVYSVPNTVGNIVWLKMIRVEHQMTAFYSEDGTKWTQIGREINVASLDNYRVEYNGWCGNRQGLYVQGSTPADFDLYIYRDAYTTIPTNSPANWFGTSEKTVADGKKILTDIHNNDWVMYAGVEFGNNDYQRVCNLVKISAINISRSSKVEIWLDSIGTGKKIATVALKKNNAINDKASFFAKTKSVNGRHDVYLRFVGVKNELLADLNSLVFISK